MLKHFHNNRGLTLVELVITMAILAIVISLVFSVNTFGTRVQSKGITQSDVQNDVRLVANYISSQVRIADAVEILSSMPASFDNQKKYFYVEGNTIKQYNLGSEEDILHETASGYIPVLEFKKNASNPKILNFTIRVTYKGQNFQMESEVLAQNIAGASTITGLSGAAVVYSCPLTDSEIVALDKMLFQINDLNGWLVPETDGSWTLLPSSVDILTLYNKGFKGSSVTWSSSNTGVISTDGNVVKPGIGAGDRIVILTATFTKGTASVTKQFTINVCDLDPLEVVNTSPTVSLSSASYFDFDANGGYEPYTFSTPDPSLLMGLTLDTNGRLLLGAVTGDYSFDLQVQDAYTPTPNAITVPVSIHVTP